MKLQPLEIKGLEQFKRAEKAKTEKPLERPVEALDHEERREKFREAVSKTAPKKTVDKEAEKNVTPSLFQLVQGKLIPDEKSQEELLDEKKERSASRSHDDLNVSKHGARENSKKSPFSFAEYLSQKPIEAVFAKEESPIRVNQAELVELFEQLVKALHVVTQSDRVETRVTLQNPPLFEGVSFTITEHTAALGQFTISFENLNNPEARWLIEQPHAIELLQATLLEKGYVLQMVTIEPKLEFEVVQEVELNAQNHDGFQDQEQDWKEAQG